MAQFGVLMLPRPDAPREATLLEELGFDVALIPDSQAHLRGFGSSVFAESMEMDVVNLFARRQYSRARQNVWRLRSA